jgi:hypothetical protein
VYTAAYAWAIRVDRSFLAPTARAPINCDEVETFFATPVKPRHDGNDHQEGRQHGSKDAGPE